MAAYPATLPSPSFEGFSAAVAMGLVRAGGATDEKQRRVFATMPHTFSLAFTMSVTVWAQWYAWATANGYRWFTLPLPSLYAGLAGVDSADLLIRFISDLQSTKISPTDVRVSVTAESAPSAIGALLAAT